MTTVTDTRRTLRPRDGLLIWVRQNLFRSRFDALLTLALGAIGLYLMFRLLRFVFINARWEIDLSPGGVISPSSLVGA